VIGLPRKRFLFLRLAALFAAGPAAASLVCEAPEFRFGVVQAATGIVSHAFVLRNAGAEELVIDEVAAPCGCIEIRQPTNRLAAGASVRLPVTLDLRLRNGEQKLAAHVCYHIRGRNEEPDVLRLSFQGTVAGTNVAAAVAPAPAVAAPPVASRRVVVELFGQLDCEACATVRQEVLPGVQRQFKGRVTVIDRDVYETTNFVALASYQKRLGVPIGQRNDPVSMVVDGCRYLGGVEEIRRGLAQVVQEQLAAEGMNAAVQPAAGDNQAVHDRFAQFTLPLVVAAGFLDGINHCAIATVIFLVSLLSVSRVRGSEYLRLGISFFLASFLTYFLVGLGLLEGMHRLAGFRTLRTLLNVAVAGAALTFAWYSFRDAWRYWRSGDAREITMQLPLPIKKAMHAVMRRGIHGGSLVVGGLVAGVAVTLLEGICTGQVYVPTLAMIARTQEHSGQAMRYLLAYNIASDIPQVVVLILGYIGIRTEALLTFSKRNALLSKILAGCFFLLLAALMLAT